MRRPTSSSERSARILPASTTMAMSGRGEHVAVDQELCHSGLGELEQLGQRVDPAHGRLQGDEVAVGAGEVVEDVLALDVQSQAVDANAQGRGCHGVGHLQATVGPVH